ncbi:membrane-bound lytic murein transglycosylase MltF [Thiohalobacter sp. COW1]|uniref:membrane-bound lytic murein transglycosylase MltF n=1 Tax=Thiohalobacter sp. COW1 TaxID=2795687 RepID=UPI001F5BB0B1|nr:membrane-bound lytic murein transglycosylase MltF [Thiohalobacter sp. COW1]
MTRRIYILLFLIAIAGCSDERSLLEEIQASGEVVMVTRNSPTSYYLGADGPTGFEYDLAQAFADHLGVRLKVVVPDGFNDILPMVASGEVHFAAAGLTITDVRKLIVRFAPSYQAIIPQLVYRANTTPEPADLDDLNGILEVLAGSSHEERLKELKATEYPELNWRANAELDSEELLRLVWEQVIDYTIADSNEIAIQQRFYPELRTAFAISDPQPLAWAFARGPDTSLYNAAKQFFFELRNSGRLAQLIERYYGHVQDFDYVGTRRYLRHIQTRLPDYTEIFQQAARDHDIDWRLLAAVGYQESHWRPDARSPTGVRGIMMLTLNTVKYLGLDDRLDPVQSIHGGAEYLRMMKEKIPERIPEPDRTWLALAAYNVGFGHLEDARRLTEANGADPDRWVDVKEHLPLLSQKKWYKQTRFGYARGHEPVQYVENIRSYYDILVWYTERDQEPVPSPPQWISDFPAL